MAPRPSNIFALTPGRPIPGWSAGPPMPPPAVPLDYTPTRLAPPHRDPDDATPDDAGVGLRARVAGWLPAKHALDYWARLLEVFLGLALVLYLTFRVVLHGPARAFRDLADRRF